MRTHTALAWFLLLNLPFLSCELSNEDCTKGYKPSGCVESEPRYGWVTVLVMPSTSNPAIPVTIYKGDMERNVVVVIDTLRVSMKDYRLENGEYSVKATYLINVSGSPSTVHSIDGGKLATDKEEYCDGNCYSEGTLELNARYP